MSRSFTLALVLVLLLGPAASRAKPRVSEARLRRISQLLLKGSPKVRLQAAVTLGYLGDGRSVPALVRALGDSVSSVRALAARALGRLGDRRAVSPLRRLGRDRSGTVRAAARAALAALEPRAPGSSASASGGRLLSLGAITDKTRRARHLLGALRTLWNRSLQRLSAHARRPGRYEVTSSISDYREGWRGSTYSVTCQVRYVLGHADGRMVLMGDGTATAEGDRPNARSKQELQVAALEGAIQGAEQKLGQYLR